MEPGDKAGKRNRRSGPIILDVSPSENESVEKRKMTASQKKRGNQYSRTSVR
jgi:hypothetical protein